MLTYSKIPISLRDDLPAQERTLWRSLVRADWIDYSNNRIGLVIPAWNSSRTLYFDMKELPEGLLKRIQANSNRFHALVNIEATKDDDIYIEPLTR